MELKRIKQLKIILLGEVCEAIEKFDKAVKNEDVKVELESLTYESRHVTGLEPGSGEGLDAKVKISI